VIGFPSGIASKQRVRVVRRFHETVKRSKNAPEWRFGHIVDLYQSGACPSSIRRLEQSYTNGQETPERQMAFKEHVDEILSICEFGFVYPTGAWTRWRCRH